MLRWLIPLVLLAAALPARADEHLPPVDDPTVIKQCGACHMPYQPQFLPRESWKKIMDRLPRHFGAKVALSRSARRQIEAYHLANAADVTDAPEGRRYHESIGVGATPLRITHVPHWQSHHARSVDTAVWKDWRVGGKGNCVACHPGAPKGHYSATGS